MSDTYNPLLLMTESEAADRLRISRRSLQRLRLEGEGPRFVKVTDSRVGYLDPDLRAWMQARTVDAARPL
jgi:predicted DNA-binding transcriptional regulator AlpA